MGAMTNEGRPLTKLCEGVEENMAIKVETKSIKEERTTKKEMKKEKKIKKEKDIKVNKEKDIDNPYMTVINKRLRSLRKKMDKIKALEEMKKKKILNDQQLEVLANKNAIERTINEYELLQSQYEQIHLEEMNGKMEEKEKMKKSKKEKEKEKKNHEEKEEEPLVHELPKPEEAIVRVEPPVNVDEMIQEKSDMILNSLLQLFHVISLCQSNEKEIPEALDYFGRVLLGKTRLPVETSFQQNLQESIDEAKLYLSQSTSIVACDLSYKDIFEIVERVKNETVEMEQVSAIAEGNENEEVPVDVDDNLVRPDLRAYVIEHSNENFNFFTESTIDKESSVEAVAGSIVDDAELEDDLNGPSPAMSSRESSAGCNNTVTGERQVSIMEEVIEANESEVVENKEVSSVAEETVGNTNNGRNSYEGKNSNRRPFHNRGGNNRRHHHGGRFYSNNTRNNATTDGTTQNQQPQSNNIGTNGFYRSARGGHRHRDPKRNENKEYRKRTDETGHPSKSHEADSTTK